MENQDQLNANADVVQNTITKSVPNYSASEMAIKPPQSYIQKAIPKVIKFSSRASIKIVTDGQDHYYTVEYGEERQIDNFNEVNMDRERQLLIDECNKQVDDQVREIVETFLK